MSRQAKPEFVLTTIDMIRHGEPVGGRCYRGDQDDPLSPAGWQQMRQAVGEHHPWDVIVSSPLQRCDAFARELAERHGIPRVLEAGLREISFGQWEGRSVEQLLQQDAAQLQRYWQDPVCHTPPEGEPLLEFEARISRAWQSLLQAHRGQHLLVVGHAGSMRMILRQVLEMPLQNLFRLHIDYASISRICIEGEEGQALPRLMFHAGQLSTD